MDKSTFLDANVHDRWSSVDDAGSLTVVDLQKGVVPHFEECSPNVVTVNCEFTFWECHGTFSYFLKLLLIV
jgi:hypothetical protein